MPHERVLALLVLAPLAAVLPAFEGEAAAQEGDLVVVPTGADQALGPTALISSRIVARLNQARPGKKRARLVYPIPPALQPTRSDEKHARKLLEKVLKSYENMEYEKVGELANEALQEYKKLLKDGVGRDGYVECQHLMAAAALFDGENKKAYKAMYDAILFDPKAPSAKLFSPQVQELYDQVTAEPPGKGFLRLSANTDAMVWFNGSLFGLMRGKAELRGGLYLVRVFRPGYAIWQKWLRVHPGSERELVVVLTKNDSKESDVLPMLRQETAEAVPGQAVQQLALENVATEVILVVAGQGCVESRCPIGLYWAKDDKWVRKVGVVHAGDVQATVEQLLAGEGLPPLEGVAASANRRTEKGCTLNRDCGIKEKCVAGRCVEDQPVTRTWWFWTIVGGVAAGVVLAIAIPVATRQGPILEVR